MTDKNKQLPTKWKAIPFGRAHEGVTKIVTENFMSLEGGGQWICSTYGNTYLSLEVYEKNAKMIVTAINNTYGKGINPESVGQLKDLLKVASLYLSLDKSDYKKEERERCIENIDKAIKKAEL